MDAACELAQLGGGLPELLGRLRDHAAQDVGVAEVLRQLEVQCDSDEALLRTVVEVAFQAPALFVGRANDPRPRRAHLFDLRAQFSAQALVLESERGRGTGR